MADPRRRPRRTARPDPARRAAFDALRAVDTREAYANLLLPRLLRERGITGRDAGLATELTYGTLRAQGTLDAVVADCVSRPLAGVDPPVLSLLRLGTYQVLRTRVPPHAAVSTIVDLARGTVGEGPARFVNAVLRRVAERDLDSWLAHLTEPLADRPIERLAVRHAHPPWIVAAFQEALGGDLEQTAAALGADEQRPSVHLAVRPGRADRDAVAEQSGGTPGRWAPTAVVLPGGDPADLPAVVSGQAHVQDEGSQLVALAVAGANLDGPDARWLDLCAGPGGKAALLAGLAGQRGAHLLAADLTPHRSRMVRRAVRGEPAGVVTADATVPAWRPGTFDRVLVDVPCTGLGSLRRRPEARWRRSPSDIPGLTRLQRELLRSALRAARPGGVVGYTTCSPHLAETRVVVAEVLKGTDAQLLDARPLLPGVPDLGDGPYVQLWPHRHGTDAMFLALIRAG